MTDATGEVYQHLEYFAFGETFIEEHSNTDRTPFLFNGKELDEETGLYYFGARYYDAKTSIFESIDRFADKFPWASPYQYAMNNPVTYIDVNGDSVDYYIRKNGEIVTKQNSLREDRFYYESSQRTEGNMTIRTYKQIDQKTQNDNGLLELTSLSTSNFALNYTGARNENYISGAAYAAVLGALSEVQYCDISFNHWSNSDGTSPSPSRSHKGGTVGDLRPLRSDQSGGRVLVTDDQFDVQRNATLITALKKFGWTSVLSEKNPSNNYITPGTTHYSGYTDKKTGKWVDVRHNNHFHIQKFKPNLIPYAPFKR